ncbi:hypothetical protein VHEMI08140 [[Torrubiella] hemipterigena]|uniref:Uncharacterized protein n=1 Tax=[Torrubiella] hemipterigena TaxID=1531966 RepID=A0A0A1TCH7_9HYPO|nr:hypothetical protein VHEMI08140 [[Torrubiella] hemipterigena]
MPTFQSASRSGLLRSYYARSTMSTSQPSKTEENTKLLAELPKTMAWIQTILETPIVNDMRGMSPRTYSIAIDLLRRCQNRHVELLGNKETTEDPYLLAFRRIKAGLESKIKADQTFLPSLVKFRNMIDQSLLQPYTITFPEQDVLWSKDERTEAVKAEAEAIMARKHTETQVIGIFLSKPWRILKEVMDKERDRTGEPGKPPPQKPLMGFFHKLAILNMTTDFSQLSNSLDVYLKGCKRPPMRVLEMLARYKAWLDLARAIADRLIALDKEEWQNPQLKIRARANIYHFSRRYFQMFDWDDEAKTLKGYKVLDLIPFP